MFVINKWLYPFLIFLLSTFLWHFFLCKIRWHGDVPPHLGQPCCKALEGLLIWGLYPDMRYELRAYTHKISVYSCPAGCMHSTKLYSPRGYINPRIWIIVTHSKSKTTMTRSVHGKFNFLLLNIRLVVETQDGTPIHGYLFYITVIHSC